MSGKIIDLIAQNLRRPGNGFFGWYVNKVTKKRYILITRLVIGTSRTVGSAKKFVRITSGFGGGEFTKTLRKNVFLKRNVLLEETAVRLCQIEPHHNVLEVGFGPGVGLEAACKFVTNGTGKIHGVDYSKKMVDVAKRRLKNEIIRGKVDIQEGNVLALPLENDTIDRSFHCNCYYFWPDLRAGCRELYRVMKPGSYMVTTIRVERMKGLKKKGYLKYGAIDHVAYMDTLTEVGFTDVHIEKLEDNEQPFEAMFAHVGHNKS